MNTTPAGPPGKHALDPALWARHHQRAASLLPGNFADNVLRAARLGRAGAAPAAALHTRLWRIFHNPFALSALTAAVCLLTVVVLRTQANAQASQENLDGWKNITTQAASLDPL